MRSEPVVVLRRGHVQPVWAGHPWVFAQAIARLRGEAADGDEVEVEDAEGNRLGRGLYSADSAITVRLYAKPGEPIDAELFRSRVERAAARRAATGLPNDATTGYRLVHGEGDGLPGLIVDRFGRDLVVQLGSTGLARRRAEVVQALRQVTDGAIVDRTSKTRGNEPRALEGQLPTELVFRELGLEYVIPITLSQKTGYYFDQRPLRQFIEGICSGKRVLDAHTYVGSSALIAARTGATAVVGVDTSAPAIEVARGLAARNELALVPHFERRDAHEVLRAVRRDERFDVVICDPPKMARSRGQRGKALGALRRLIGVACQATADEGVLIVSSCSSAIGLTELGRVASLAAADARCTLTTLERVFQGADHPVPAAFPEGLYLSTLVFRLER